MPPTHHAAGGIDSWIIFVVVGSVILLIGILIWLISRKTVSSDGLTPNERKALSSEQKEILSMARQKGEPVTQIEIVDIIPGGLEYVVEILKNMEAKGLIRRIWDSEKGTYLISSTKD
jgi:DNA-binding MarR family transcriptional regulator